MAEQTAIAWCDSTKRPGPSPHPPRDGDKLQARQRINVEVRSGRRPHPNTLPCSDCGHLWREGERRHEYDHHMGYAAQNHGDVQAVCTLCHAARDNTKKSQTHCKAGHAFSAENTGRRVNGGRFCRQCRRDFDKTRNRDAGYWRAYRESRNV